MQQPIAPAPSLPPQRSHEDRRHRVFFGPEGLRAGWGCLVFALMLGLLGFFLSLFAHALYHPAPRPRGAALAPSSGVLLAEALEAAAVLLVTWLMSRLEHRPFGSLGWRDGRRLPRFTAGLAAGAAALSTLVGVLWSCHLLVLHGPVIHGTTAWRDGFAWALGFTLVAVFEESLLRGYLLFKLARGIGFLPAAVLLAFSFGAIHGSNPGETPVGLFSAGAAGLLFSLSIWYTGSLWWAIGFHAAWDWSQSFLWGTADSGVLVQGHLFAERAQGPALWSGGVTGPEGSLLIFPLLLAVALLMALWWRGQSPLRRSMLRDGMEAANAAEIKGMIPR